VIVGYNHGAPRALRHAPGVELAGYVHDLGEYYASAAVATAPLNSGGGTRLKVIEALARRVPIVATSFGCAGLGMVHGKHALIAESAELFADACVTIIRDPALADRLTAAGFRHYEESLTAEQTIAAVARVARSTMRLDRPVPSGR